ncbi:glycoside hydrolase family 36 protein [Streptomyces sp. NPDC057681]|uniref:glycoside hydrolase family 36 protein n=1 Tax=Streptomyces sp. NPDC057681 TaxID=3346209 RepID=UPI003694E249
MSAVTTAERPAAPETPLIGDVTVALLGGRFAVRDLPGGLLALDVTAPKGTAVEIRLAVPLRDAVGFWHPACGWERTLLADWAGRIPTSLIKGAPVGCLYETSGATTLAFAAQDPVIETELVFGISEATKRFVVHLHLVAGDGPYTLAFAPRASSVATALRSLRGHLAETAALPPLPIPAAGRAPAYSTWYAFGQDVHAEAVEAEAARAAGLGCGTLILDDGWVAGGDKRGYAWAGDWAVDPAKFPDLAGHVRRVKELGLAYLVWVAPLLLGPESAAWERMRDLAPLPSPVTPGAYVLDPRRPEVRAHIVALCAGLVADHGLDGLKIDFLDEAQIYAGDGEDIGLAMAVLLDELRAALEAIRPGIMIELRQPYLGHGMAAYGNLLRASDCPADAVANRVRTLDIGLLALGGAVHSDMLMWDPDGSPESAARQLLSVLTAVPQLSSRLDRLRDDHRAALEFWLRTWTRLRPVLLDGEVEPGRPDELYPIVRARADGHQVVMVHAERIAPVDLARTRLVEVVNVASVPRVTLDVTGSSDVEETVRNATGALVGTRRFALGPGLHSLTVPPSGLLSLRLLH